MKAGTPKKQRQKKDRIPADFSSRSDSSARRTTDQKKHDGVVDVERVKVLVLFKSLHLLSRTDDGLAKQQTKEGLTEADEAGAQQRVGQVARAGRVVGESASSEHPVNLS